MFALVLTLCMSQFGCHESAPAIFDTLAECKAERVHLTQSGQAQPAAMHCEFWEADTQID